MSTDDSNNSNPTETTASNSQTTTVDKSDAELKHDSVNDWHSDEEFVGIKFSKKLGLLWCASHLKCINRGGMTKHFAAYHGKQRKTKAPPGGLGPQLDAADKPTIAVYMTPEQMILEDHNREIAEAAGMLAKDYELRAEFEMLHQQDKIPYDWSFYDWIKLGTVVNYNEKWKYDLSLNQDMSLLDDKQRDWLRLTYSENEQKKKAEAEVIIE